MFNHISIGVRDIARTKTFYDAALKPLGFKCLSESEGSLGYGKEAVALWIGETKKPVPADDKSNLHFCFDAPTRKSVDAFHDGAMKSGARRARCKQIRAAGKVATGAPSGPRNG